MAEQPQIISTFLRNPLSFAIIIFTIVIAIIYLDYRSLIKPESQLVTSTPPSPIAQAPNPWALKPSTANSGRTQPKIMDNLGGPTTGEGGGMVAPGLEGLIAGLESKVAADPSNVGQRILLAQTYKELTLVGKALETLRKLQQDFPEQARVKLVAASVLSQSEEEKDLKESLTLLEALLKSKSDEVKPYLVNMYLGDTHIRLKNHKDALENWKLALETMPPTDNRYSIIESRINDLDNKKIEKKDSAV